MVIPNPRGPRIEETSEGYYWPRNAFRFNIGGGKFWNSPGSPTYDPLRQSLEPKKPTTPAVNPVPTPTPPITAASAEVIQAEQDLRRQSLKKRGFSSTIHAGDTGGWNPATPRIPTVGAGAGKLG